MGFDFNKEYVLENDIVILEPLKQEHFNDLEVVGQDEGIWTYFLGKSNGEGRIKEYMDDAIAQREARQAYPFAILHQQSKRYVGSTRFFDFSEDGSSVRLGYSWLGEDFRGRGVNKNCKYLLFQFAFEEMGFERIGLGAHEENTISIAAMRSIGLKQEGRIRNLFPGIKRPGRADALLFGSIKDEWFKEIKANLKLRL